jgi:hypothetical protein
MMDPELGMGIEFLGRTGQHRHRLEELIEQMTANPNAVAEALVEPEGLDWDGDVDSTAATTSSPEDEVEHDPLLELFRTGATLPKEQFLLELEKHRVAVSPEGTSEPNSTEPTVHQRREPRIVVSLPVQVWDQEHEESLRQTASMIDVSHHGARIGDLAFHLKAGDVVHLVSDGGDARFRVIWVGESGTPQEGQIGLQSLKTDN